MSAIEFSLVIASQEPQKLSEFYAFATNGDLLPGSNDFQYWIVLSSGLKIKIYRPSQKLSFLYRGRSTALCLEQPPTTHPLLSVREWATTLIPRGASLVEDPKLESFGAESWMTDPEGNYFLLLVPKI